MKPFIVQREHRSGFFLRGGACGLEIHKVRSQNPRLAGRVCLQEEQHLLPRPEPYRSSVPEREGSRPEGREGKGEGGREAEERKIEREGWEEERERRREGEGEKLFSKTALLHSILALEHVVLGIHAFYHSVKAFLLGM